MDYFGFSTNHLHSCLEIKQMELEQYKGRMVNRVIIQPLIASITGFGMFWWYRLFNWNIWACIFMALFTSALMSRYIMR